MKWISVKDQLPPIGKFVCAYSSDAHTLWIAAYPGDINEEYQKHWEIEETMEFFYIRPTPPISHWLELPQPKYSTAKKVCAKSDKDLDALVAAYKKEIEKHSKHKSLF